jgi:hypothetical protein
MGNICTNNNGVINEQNYNLSSQIYSNTSHKNNSSFITSSLNNTIPNTSLLKSNSYYKQQANYRINNNFEDEKLNKLNSYPIKKINFLNSRIKGFLLRKNYKDYLKLDLLDFANELYFQFLSKAKNKRVSEIINNDKNQKIMEYVHTNWSEFYEKDPNEEINLKINKTKKYIEGLIFKYKSKNFHSNDLDTCLDSALYCYKGSVNIYTNKKCGYGELIYLDGSQKIGTFYNDEFVGWNTYVNYEGILFVGYFFKNKLNGKGLKYNPDNDHLYKGDFVNGMRHGYGNDFRNNSKYKGQFYFDKKHGNGEIELITGDVYKGEFKNNKISGYGHYIWKNNNHEYIGYFLDGKFHGEGYYKWGDNQYFKGNYINGIKEGRGEIGFNNGKKCFVNFVNGEPCGKGTLIDKNHNIIETEFENGKLKNQNTYIFE